MSHIRGDITKVYEVLKKGYEQPIVQETKNYSFNTGALLPGTYTYDITAITSGKTGYVKKISITCDDLTSLNAVDLYRIDGTGPWNFFTSYFFINGEWFLGDTPIYDTTGWQVVLYNLAVGNVTFTVNIYWVES